MNFDNIFSKVEGNADKIGGAIGFLTGSPNGLADVESILANIMAGHIHAPDFAELGLQYSPHIKSGLMAFLVGWGIEEVDVNPMLTKIGKAAKGFGLAYALGSAIQRLLWVSTHSDGAVGTTPSNNPRGYAY